MNKIVLKSANNMVMGDIREKAESKIYELAANKKYMSISEKENGYYHIVIANEIVENKNTVEVYENVNGKENLVRGIGHMESGERWGWLPEYINGIVEII